MGPNNKSCGWQRKAKKKNDRRSAFTITKYYSYEYQVGLVSNNN